MLQPQIKEIACGEVERVTGNEVFVKISHRQDAIRKTSHVSKRDKYVELVFDKSEVAKSDTVVRPDLAVHRENASVNADPDGNPDVNVDDENQSWPTGEDGVAEQLIDGLHKIGRDPQSVATRDLMNGKDDLKISSSLLDSDSSLNLGYTSNVTLGVTYIFPMAQYQQALNDNFTAGVMASILSTPVSNGSLSGVGGYFTLNAYSIEPFHGAYVQLGVGIYSLDGNVNNQNTNYASLAGIGNVGWRWLWESGLNFGFGVGVQYLFQPKPSGNALDFGGLLPSVAMDLGFAF